MADRTKMEQAADRAMVAEERRLAREKKRQEMRRTLMERRKAAATTPRTATHNRISTSSGNSASGGEDELRPVRRRSSVEADREWKETLKDVYGGTVDDGEESSAMVVEAPPQTGSGSWPLLSKPPNGTTAAAPLALPKSWSDLSLVSSSSSGSSLAGSPTLPDPASLPTPPPTISRRSKAKERAATTSSRLPPLSAADFPLPPSRPLRVRSSSFAARLHPTPSTPQATDLSARRRAPQAPPPTTPLPPLPTFPSPPPTPLIATASRPPPQLPPPVPLPPPPGPPPGLSIKPVPYQTPEKSQRRTSSIPVSPDFDPRRPPQIPLPPLPPNSPYLDLSGPNKGPVVFLSPRWAAEDFPTARPPTVEAFAKKEEAGVSPKTKAPSRFLTRTKVSPPIDPALFETKPLPPLPEEAMPQPPPVEAPQPSMPLSDPEEEDDTRMWSGTEPSSGSTGVSSLDDLVGTSEMPFARDRRRRTASLQNSATTARPEVKSPDAIDEAFADAEEYEGVGEETLDIDVGGHSSGSDSELDLDESLDGMAVRLGYRAPSEEGSDEASVRHEAFGVEEDVEASRDEDGEEKPAEVGLGLGLRWSTMMRSAQGRWVQEKERNADDLTSSTMSYRGSMQGSIRPSPRTSKYSPIRIDEPSSSDEEEFDMTLDLPSPGMSRHLAPPRSPLTTPRARTSMQSSSSSLGSAGLQTPLFDSIKNKTSSATLSSDGMLSPVIGFKHPPGKPGSPERQSWLAANKNRVSSASAPEATPLKPAGDAEEPTAKAVPRRSSEGDRMASPPPSPVMNKRLVGSGLRRPSQSRLKTPGTARRPTLSTRTMTDPLAETAITFATAGAALSTSGSPCIGTRSPKVVMSAMSIPLASSSRTIPKAAAKNRAPSPASSTASSTASKLPSLKHRASKPQNLKLDTTASTIPATSSVIPTKSSIPGPSLRYKSSVASLSSKAESRAASPSESLPSPQVQLRPTKLRPLILPTGTSPPTGLNRFGRPLARVTSSPSLSSLKQEGAVALRGPTSPQTVKPKSMAGRFSGPAAPSSRQARFGFASRTAPGPIDVPPIGEADELGRIVEVAPRATAIQAPRSYASSSLPVSRANRR